METVGAYEAKTHLPKLLERVQRGEYITITKHGVPVAVLSPPDPESVKDVESVIADLRRFRDQHHLDGLTISEMLEDGRR
jgi:prevent-host-death family protein